MLFELFDEVFGKNDNGLSEQVCSVADYFNLGLILFQVRILSRR
jgi:hypothetical protein